MHCWLQKVTRRAGAPGGPVRRRRRRHRQVARGLRRSGWPRPGPRRAPTASAARSSSCGRSSRSDGRSGDEPSPAGPAIDVGRRSATPSAGSRTRRSTGRSPTSACWARCRSSGGRVRVEVRLTTPTCPLRETFGAAVTAAVHSVAPDADGRGRLRGPRRAGPPRPVAAAARRPHRRPDARRPRIYAVASGKGGVGKSLGDGQPRRRPRRPGPGRRPARRRRVGLLGAPAVRRATGAGRAQRDHVPGRGARRPADVASASSCPRTSRSSGAGRCCTRRSSSSSPTSTGATSTSCCSTSRPAPATSRCRCSSCVPDAALLAVTTPQPRRADGRQPGRPDGQGRADAGRRRRREHVVAGLRGLRPRDGAVRLRRRAAARRRDRARRCSARCRSTSRCGSPGTTACRWCRRDPTAPSAQVLRQLAADLPVVRRSLVGVPLPLSVA